MHCRQHQNMVMRRPCRYWLMLEQTLLLKEGDYSKALQVASYGGPERVAQILVDTGGRCECSRRTVLRLLAFGASGTRSIGACRS
jgi:hypothetical protein